MILFGRRKFAVMLTLGSTLSWLTLEVFDALAPGLLSINGLPIAALFVPALLANDMERTSVVAVATGGILAGSATLSVVTLVAGLVDGTGVVPWAPPLLAISFGALLWPRLKARLAGGRRADKPANVARPSDEIERDFDPIEPIPVDFLSPIGNLGVEPNPQLVKSA
jgi:hypothetical protein